jgi:hypothetical protein
MEEKTADGKAGLRMKTLGPGSWHGPKVAGKSCTANRLQQQDL